MTSDKATAHELLQACNRRTFVRRASLAGMAGAVLPAAASFFTAEKAVASPPPSAEGDIAILNFALNLEYLESQFYLYAVTGAGLPETETFGGDGTPGGKVTVKSTSTKVNFQSSIVAGYAAEIADDEANHVRFLRNTLGSSAAAQPDIDLLNSFNGVGQLAFGANFDPFADDLSFLLGAFIFEDVGVTAYHGAAPRLLSKTYLAAAAAILAVEAFHASEVRTVLYNMSQDPAQTVDIATMVQSISNLRDSLDSGNEALDKDQGIVVDGAANIVPADAHSVAFGRTTRQVLRIVYGMSTANMGVPGPGTFFPSGTTGAIH